MRGDFKKKRKKKKKRVADAYGSDTKSAGLMERGSDIQNACVSGGTSGHATDDWWAKETHERQINKYT